MAACGLHQLSAAPRAQRVMTALFQNDKKYLLQACAGLIARHSTSLSTVN